jgi:hypothetical protein
VRPVSPQVSTPVPAQHANMRCIMHALRRERAGPLRYVHLDCLRSQSRPVRGRPPHVHMCVYDHVPVDLALSAPPYRDNYEVISAGGLRDSYILNGTIKTQFNAVRALQIGALRTRSDHWFDWKRPPHTPRRARRTR